MHRPNPEHSLFDLLELTTLYQESNGVGYWLLDCHAFGLPDTIWPLPSHLVRPVRKENSKKIVDFYEYRAADGKIELDPDDLIIFRYPDPRNPYSGGLSPQQAAYDFVHLDSELVAFKQSLSRNQGIPGVVINPKEQISPDERDRIEVEWNVKFTRCGQGKALVAERGMDVKTLEQRLGDLVSLAEQGATKETIANAYHVPTSYLTKETNLANLEAADRQHAALAIRPRVRRRDSKLNDKLLPFFDTSGRLYLESDDPAAVSQDFVLKQELQDLQTGIRTINQVRNDRGLEPVEWGHLPWLDLDMAPTDFERWQETICAPQVGRAKPSYTSDREDRHQPKDPHYTPTRQTTIET